MKWNGFEVDDNEGFDTVRWKSDAPVEGYNVKYEGGYITLSLDELSDFDTVFDIVNTQKDYTQHKDTIYQAWDYIVNYKWHSIPERTKPWLQQEVFKKYHSETDMMRYIYELCSKDFSLVNGMVPLGSCTMKLNAASELMPVSWEEFANVHPHTPMIQTMGYQKIIDDLQKWLCDITGFDSISLQPNAGSQGEYAGLLAIQAYHQGSGDDKRNVCLIPESAHGTNPASAVMAGMKVVGVKCDEEGNIDIKDLEKKAIMNTFELSCIMITYPSTHGVFETNIRQICKIVHENGGQVYLDGANLNAQVGLAKPCDYGADVCHLNLHKTFCIPHGWRGCACQVLLVAKHLTPFVTQSISSSTR